MPGFGLRFLVRLRHAAAIAILGLVFDKKGALVIRFSDIACPRSESYDGPFPPPTFVSEELERVVIPSGYETEVNLKLGDYRLELLLTDGEKFGRASASLAVEDFPQKRSR